MEDISALSYPVAFAAGFVSFISPCVLAVVPGYLTFISGVSFDELGARTKDVLAPTLAFVPDVMPETARQLDDLLAAARAGDAKVAEARAGATYAGDEDPYRRPDDEDEDKDDDERD